MNTALLDNYRFLGRYNRWMNQRLYAACEALTDVERKQARGAFFSSIHHTLTHLVMADKMWFQRFAAQDCVFAALPAALLTMRRRRRLQQRSAPGLAGSASNARRAGCCG